MTIPVRVRNEEKSEVGGDLLVVVIDPEKDLQSGETVTLRPGEEVVRFLHEREELLLRHKRRAPAPR